ncbi:hypothetical protein BDY21DRAFT_336660 [Lineolata rhizophorae]|uniref:Uncharacterized protein n=1 Tax=Lineolata rhizophorae TaxID=578093 RepID=A0A6A6P780_9PEZI|nr:hypothetical protein BDY21DRAFT_336660 [Lineolata rhizophorae]
MSPPAALAESAAPQLLRWRSYVRSASTNFSLCPTEFRSDRTALAATGYIVRRLAMAPTAIPANGYPADSRDTADVIRPVKRLKTHRHPEDSDVAHSVAIPSHPLGLKPSGNAYTATANAKDYAGSFGRLPDDLLVQILEYMNAPELVQLGTTCKALYAFTRAEELWKSLCVESPPTHPFRWRGTWRQSYLSLSPSRTAAVQCPTVFSDALHRPFHCAHTPLNPFTSSIPPANEIPRISDLSAADYEARWASTPFILTEPVKAWPAYCDGTFETDRLVERWSDVVFRAEAVEWKLKIYVEYMRNQEDESPVYLFDRGFVEKMGIEVGKQDGNRVKGEEDTHNKDRKRIEGEGEVNNGMEQKEEPVYWPPECFGEDLFAVLGEQRPDCRWLIVGPERSGSSFHKDPNGTSAWNAVIAGSKYWLMFPPSTPSPPPGIILSPDSSEITSPLSIPEYLLSFHALARATPGCREGVCAAGEVLHVPAGWFHLVLNLEESVAVTQNFVPRRKLGEVLRFLKEKPDQVSGFRDEVEDAFGLFVERLRESGRGEVLEEGLREMKSLEAKEKWAGRSGKWEELVRGGKEEGEKDGAGFTFGFGSDEDDE